MHDVSKFLSSFFLCTNGKVDHCKWVQPQPFHLLHLKYLLLRNEAACSLPVHKWRRRKHLDRFKIYASSFATVWSWLYWMLNCQNRFLSTRSCSLVKRPFVPADFAEVGGQLQRSHHLRICVLRIYFIESAASYRLSRRPQCRPWVHHVQPILLSRWHEFFSTPDPSSVPLL